MKVVGAGTSVRGGRSTEEKGETGLVGLVNQGATCYLNSLIQALFFTPEVRAAVHSWEYDANAHGAVEECQPLQLQELFATLELGETAAAKTEALTRSFGWTSAEAFEQQDAQEFCKVLLDRLEEVFTSPQSIVIPNL